jgi:signal peptidase II
MNARGLAAVVLGVVAADRTTKLLIMSSMERGESIPVVPGLFSLTYVHNPGAAFGVFANSSVREPLLVLVAIAAIVGLLWLIAKTPASHVWERTAAAAIIGGALGNLYDRFAYRSVVDFLDFYVGNWHWPAFNVADSCITVGVGVLLISSLLTHGDDDAPSTEQEDFREPHRKAA